MENAAQARWDWKRNVCADTLMLEVMASSTRRWEQILRLQELLLQAPSCGQGCRPGCSRCAAPPGLGGARWKAGREPRWGGGKKGGEQRKKQHP